MASNKYDDRNTLNDLTGSEWVFNTKTVINKSYPINMQHKLRSQHGGQKPPELCKELIEIFTKRNQLVLDPFMGVGGTLLGASLCGRSATGIDLSERWINTYKEVCLLENVTEQETLCGNSFDKLDELPDDSFDFILTDVPYWNMDTLKKTRSKKSRKTKLSNFAENDSTASVSLNLPDNSEQTKEEWLFDMSRILLKAVSKLKKGKYMAVFIGDLYRGKEYHFLTAELALRLSKDIPNINLKSNIVWIDNSKGLHVYGYPRAYVPSLVHQNILIFRKEE